MPIKSLWNIRRGLINTEAKRLYYGMDHVASFECEILARRVLTLLITAGDTMEFTDLGDLELKIFIPGQPENLSPQDHRRAKDD